jgi:hypothetical protein
MVVGLTTEYQRSIFMLVDMGETYEQASPTAALVLCADTRFEAKANAPAAYVKIDALILMT